MTKEVAVAVKPTKDQIRAAFFGAKPKTKIVTLENGMDIEVRQPKVGAQLEIAESENSKQRMVRMLIMHTYVPGTEELLFDEADFDGILNAPAGSDYGKILDAMNELMGVRQAVKEQAKN